MKPIRLMVLAFVLPVFTLSAHGQIGKALQEAKDIAKALEKGKVNAAMAQIKILDLAIDLYRDNNANVPDSLDVLLKPDPTNDGRPYILKNTHLVDPWGKKYQYDPKGPMNAGKRPDIWTVTGDKKVIGNFKIDK